VVVPPAIGLSQQLLAADLAGRRAHAQATDGIECIVRVETMVTCKLLSTGSRHPISGPMGSADVRLEVVVKGVSFGVYHLNHTSGPTTLRCNMCFVSLCWSHVPLQRWSPHFIFVACTVAQLMLLQLLMLIADFVVVAAAC
jgi:hypothetical protein